MSQKPDGESFDADDVIKSIRIVDNETEAVLETILDAKEAHIPNVGQVITVDSLDVPEEGPTPDVENESVYVIEDKGTLFRKTKFHGSDSDTNFLVNTIDLYVKPTEPDDSDPLSKQN
jgi:hypothetical protein